MAKERQKDIKTKLPRVLENSRWVVAYNADIALEMCEEIAQGRTLKAVCDSAERYPSRATFYKWVVNNPDLAAAFQAAREVSAHALEEEALGLAREIKADKEASGTKVRAFEVAMNQFRWSATRRNPKVYSDRAAVNVTVPIQINSSLDLSEGTEPQTGNVENVYDVKATQYVPLDEALPEVKSLVPQKDVGLIDGVAVRRRVRRKAAAAAKQEEIIDAEFKEVPSS